MDNLQLRVALLAEGVDRNIKLLPAFMQDDVALLAEGVDRNSIFFWLIVPRCHGRPPRGGRG